ncbi:MAG: DUF5320 domain-containing protein [Patescibacteria group bacterium]|jgi:hypothetical protein
MNGTGPRGEGPKTGRGLGKCSGTNGAQSTANDNENRGLGRGRNNCPSRGLGLGRGCRNRVSN